MIRSQNWRTFNQCAAQLDHRQPWRSWKAPIIPFMFPLEAGDPTPASLAATPDDDEHDPCSCVLLAERATAEQSAGSDAQSQGA